MPASATTARLVGALAALVALVLAPRAAAAQALRVRAVEETSARPLAGAIADVLDARDSVVAIGVLSADGRRLLALPAPGSYRVRIRRIGYTPYIAPAVTLAGADTLDVALTAPARRVVLRTVTVTARRCSRDAFRDPALGDLWDAIRTALTATTLGAGDDTLRLEARPFRRIVDDDRRTVREELVGLPRLVDASQPYAARPAEELASEGYVRVEEGDSYFFAPDADVLLSDTFLSGHCFETVRGTDAASGLFGLRFSPAERRNVNDIAGTLWVDSASAELRYLDFWYVAEGLPRSAAGEDHSGGQVVFERLASGPWIVGAWRLRLPVFRPQDRLVRNRPVESYQETGGVVTPPDTGAVAVPWPVLAPYYALLAPARIVGVVYDSLAMQPLAGARVWLVPTGSPSARAANLESEIGTLAVSARADTADATGRFSLAGIPSGPYRLGFEHPTLDSLGLQPTRYTLWLKPGMTVAADLAVPSLATLASGCTAGPAESDTRRRSRTTATDSAPAGGVVFGIVRSAADERPLAGALVRATWVDLSRALGGTASTQMASETRTDSTGFYRVCGIPDSTIVVVQAAGPNSRTGEVDAQLGPLGVARVNLQLAEVDSGETAPQPGTLAGAVADSAGHPVVDALVVLDGSGVQTRTDSSGAFRLRDVPAGTQTVEVRRVGLAPARRSVNVVPGDTSRVALTLVRSQLLETILVTAARRSAVRVEVADAVRRHKSGIGHLFTEEQLARRVSIPNVLQDVPGVSMARASYADNSLVPWMRSPGLLGGECVARLFVDGIEQDYDMLALFTPDEVAAIEVYRSPNQAPFFAMNPSHFGRSELCGVVIVWTKP